MHTPPTVEYPLGPSRWFGRAWVLLWAFALSVPMLWLWQAGPGESAPWIAMVVALLTATLATRVGRVVGNGTLVWDSNTWWWERGSTRSSGLVTCELDLQNMLLLRFVSDVGLLRWFWLERGMDPVHWLALRRAVMAQGGGWRGPDGTHGDLVKGSEPVTRP